MKIFKNKENLLILVLSLVLVATLTIGKVVADTISAADIPMKDNSSTTIKSRLDTLASKSRPTTCPSNAECIWKKSWSQVAVGDYVRMTPTKTSYTIDTSKTGYTEAQTIYPSELKLWRVIRKNSNGTVDLISEYVSSTSVNFKGIAGYANYVGYLNTLASQYENSTYTSGSRYMGYNGQTQIITNTTAFNGSSTTVPWTSSTTSTANQKPSNEAQGGGDTLYTTDTELVKIAYGNQGNASLVAKKCNDTSCSNPTTAHAYWLASRCYSYFSSTGFLFNGRDVSASGSLGCSSIRIYSSGWNHRSYSYALRPILTLKSGLSASDAVGSSTDPFILG